MTTESFEQHPDTCGCCQAEVPAPTHDNRPGQAALAYRIGTHAAFLQRMLARLPQQEIPDGTNQGQRPLAALTTRAPEDPAIAFLDAWATVSDVLTFYHERIANEGFLRTATERRSILEMARAIGYELNPGVAASTYLVFKVDESASTPDTATIPAGTQVQSIPAAQGELPQTFETTEEFEARVAWNALRPRTTEPDTIAVAKTGLYLHGVSTQLQPGDAIVIVGVAREQDPTSNRWALCILQTVEPNFAGNYTYVTWEAGLETPIPDETAQVYAFRQRAALFGYNAPDWRVMSEDVKKAFDPAVDLSNPGELWPHWAFGGELDPVFPEVDLDAVYPRILASSWLAFVDLNDVELYNVTAVTNAARADFALTGKTTRVTVDPNQNLDRFNRRATVVFAQSELLARAEKPLTTLVEGNTIELGSVVDGLQAGQPIIITGKLDEADEDDTSEVAFIDSISANDTYTTLVLQAPLAQSYVRATVTIAANVVHATHGETVHEVLGSGNGAQTNQQFKLKKPPLTYVPAATASGAESTLELRVNGVLWQEAFSLYALGPTVQSYIVRINNDAEATVIFGDGKQGARLPSGPENVTATYRAGLGSAGEVGAASLKLLKTRPFGVREVINPVAASGAADPEQLENARTNAPLTVLTLERVVSLQDFEDFAGGFTGIGKAQAVSLWNGEAYLVHITVADDDGDAVPEDVLQKLAAAIDAARDPMAEVHIDNYELLTFNLEATVQYDARYIDADVHDDIAQALQAAFSFDQRDFGQPVTAAEIISVMHQVAGVVAVDLDALYVVPADSSTQVQVSGQTTLASVLPVLIARRENSTILPAQLLLINAAGISLTMQPI